MSHASRTGGLPAWAVVLLAGVLLALGMACRSNQDPLVEIRELQERGRFAETVDPLRRLVDRDPTRIEAQLLLGVALLRTGDAGLAIWPLRRAAESPEHAVPAGKLLTRAMLDSRSAHDAIAAIERVLSIAPDDVEALQLRAEAQLALGSPEKALADIDRVTALDPTNLEVLVPRVLALLSTDRIDEAETALEVARERLEGAPDAVSPSARARLCVARGLFDFEKGNPEAAEKRYETCLADFPTDPLVLSEAIAFFDRTDRPERATGILRDAAERSESPALRIALARRMGASGDAEAEERLLREGAEQQPSPTSWFALADYYVQRDAFEPALDAFEHALAASASPSPLLRFAYADTLVQAGRLDEALRVAEQIPESSLRELIRGRVLLSRGDAQGALVAFEAGIRLWPNNAASRFLAGQAAERIGDFERASSEYRESVRANAAQTKAGLALAELLEVTGEHAAALDTARRYVSTHADDPEGYVVAIRIADRANQQAIASEGLARLAALPGQAPRAKAEEAALLSARQGPDAAIGALERSGLDLADPANARALRALLAQLAARGDHERAQRLVDAALLAHPDASVLHELRGSALRAAGRPPELAQQAFERAVELDPRNRAALVGLAELEAAAGESARAIALYDRAADAAPDDPAPAHAAARLLLEAHDTKGAAQRLEALLARHPREASAALELARIAADRGERERARQLAERSAWFRTPGAEELLARLREPGDETRR